MKRTKWRFNIKSARSYDVFIYTLNVNFNCLEQLHQKRDVTIICMIDRGLLSSRKQTWFVSNIIGCLRDFGIISSLLIWIAITMPTKTTIIPMGWIMICTKIKPFTWNIPANQSYLSTYYPIEHTGVWKQQKWVWVQWFPFFIESFYSCLSYWTK